MAAMYMTETDHQVASMVHCGVTATQDGKLQRLRAPGLCARLLLCLSASLLAGGAVGSFQGRTGDPEPSLTPTLPGPAASSALLVFLCQPCRCWHLVHHVQSLLRVLPPSSMMLSKSSSPRLPASACMHCMHCCHVIGWFAVNDWRAKIVLKVSGACKAKVE